MAEIANTGKASGTLDSGNGRALACLLACALSFPLHIAHAADELTAIQASLDKQIIDPALPLAEMRAFLEPRIVQPPRAVNKFEWEQAAAKLRRDVLDKIVFRGSAAVWRDAPAKVEWLDTNTGGPGYRIRKFRYEALPGMWIPGLLYRPDKPEGRLPLALHLNGHDPLGKAADYKQIRSINLAKRGMLVLNVEWFGMGQLRTDGFSHGRMNQLELCGAGGLAPFYLTMKRALDVGLSLEHADPKRVVVSGLSGGGWQTILISSLDERVTLANPVAGYGSFHTNLTFDDMGDSEQAPTDLAALADYTHLTALRAPRPTLLTYNAKDDCCFQSGHALEPLLNSARPIFDLYSAGFDLRAHVNHTPGTHNFEQDNREQLYGFIGDYFFADDKKYSRTEIASKDELKTPLQLEVPLPDNNVDFHRLAESLAKTIPSAAPPTDKQAADAWQRERRQRLAELLRIPRYEVASTKHEEIPDEHRPVVSHRLRIGGNWTVPAIEFAQTTKAASGTVVLVVDTGRAAQAAEVERLLHAGHRVIAVDPLSWGESKIKAQDPDYLYALFLAAVGERPLGIQAAQLAAVARWAQAENSQPITIVAVGPRSATAALVAAAIEPQAIQGLELVDALSSFREIIERNLAVEAMPELFAFGLLAEFDVSQLVALSAPREVRFRAAGERDPSPLAQ
jgi:cephalosporin-C deacetylase-like acetyl esterase